MFQRIFCLIAILTCIFEINAQNLIKVKDFKEADMAVSANLEKVLDPNEGEYCPLVIVRNAQLDGFRFPDAVKTIFGKDPKTGKDVYWVYLPCRSSKITITNYKHKLGELTYKFYGINNLRSGRTYDLVLDIPVSKAIRGKQYLTINVTPVNASIEVFANGQTSGDMWLATNGSASREIEPGTYHISVSAPNYHTITKEINFHGEEPETVQIDLKPNFGYVSIKPTDELAGAGIFIDNLNVAIGSLTDHLITSGTHKLKISKELYKTYETEFTISDNQRLQLEPKLIADFATTTISTSDPEAEIWRDGKLLGKGSWRGTLPRGTYMFETRRDNYRTHEEIVNVEASSTPLEIILDSPTPILGSLSVESSPIGATIQIDGKHSGTTPRSFHDLYVGPHTVALSLPGYKTITRNVTITENNPQRITETLISTARPKAEKPKKPEQKVTTPKPQKSTIVKPNQKAGFLKKTGGYVELGASAPGNIGIYAAAGGYISGFNMEISTIIGLQKSQKFDFFGQYIPEYGTSLDGRDCQYKSYELGFKFGYGLGIGSRFMLTPQIGINDVIIKSLGDSSNALKSANILSGAIGIRTYFAISKNLGVALIPEYRFKIASTETINTMANLDKHIKNWIEGFNCKLSFTFCY